MKKRAGNLFLLKEILYIILILLTGCTAIIFSVLYLDTFDSGFFSEYSLLITAVAVAIITSATILSIMFYKLSKDFIYKLCYLTIAFIAAGTIFLYILKISGFLDKIDSVEDFRKYISSFGVYATIFFIIIQYLQVVVLPIPAFITVGAGVLLFGPFKGALLSCIGIIAGSVTAFFIGRVFGYRVAGWLVGKESLKKGLKTIKGKDKIILTFMFLFPFFPDDVLCFVAGITTMSPTFFIIMIFITRIISVFVSSYSMNNSIIPYNTWWGILIWILVLIFTVFITIIIYKKGENLEKRIKSLFCKKRQNNTSKNR